MACVGAAWGNLPRTVYDVKQNASGAQPFLPKWKLTDAAKAIDGHI